MDADKIKAFFIHHIEKMILVAIIGVAVFLLYCGYGLPNFLDEHQPDRLSADATQVKSDIDEDHNQQIIPPRVPTLDIVKRTIERDTPVEYDAYPLSPWEGKTLNTIVRRQDPILLAPRALITTPVATSIAIRGGKEEDGYLLAGLEGAEPLEKVEPKKKRPPRRSRRRNMMDEGMMEMDMMMEMEMEMGYEMEMEMDMGMGSTASGPNRRLDAKFDQGMRPTTTADRRNPEPSVGIFIAGTAVVPHKELYEAFELAFRDAEQYDPRRDTPFYYNFEVQRADVTDKPVEQLVDGDWTTIWHRELYTLLAARKWSGFAPEIVPADYRDDALTMWIPPVLVDDYRSFAVHPLIPMQPHRDLKRAAERDAQEDEPLEEFSLDQDSDVGLALPGQRGGISYGGPGMEMDYMEMDMEMEMSGMMMGFGRGGIETDPVDYKLIRFYDFAGFKNSGKFGRKYVYRLRYAVNDPNFPFSQTLQPKPSSLGPEVLQRVQQLMAKAVEEKQRSFQRWSEWSEPSDPVSLPSAEQFFAGPVNPGTVNIWQVDGKDVEYTRDPPSAKIVASQFDLDVGARIPMRLDVTEGSVLSHKAESADVVDPITLNVKKLPEAELVSGTVVIDLDGGAPMKITQDLEEPLKEPGLMLLFDQTGKLKVASEVADQEPYRIHSFADERGE